MKTDAFTKALFVVISTALVILASQSLRSPNTPVRAAARQQWEHTRIIRSREYNSNGFHDNRAKLTVTDWVCYQEDTTLSSCDIDAIMKDLGNKGWELVSIAPYSSDVAYAGIATDVIYAFKRVKP